MKAWIRTSGRLAADAAHWRKRLLSALAVMILAAPNPAYPYELEQLLRLPLERLLQLEISPPRISRATAHEASTLRLGAARIDGRERHVS